MSKQCCQQNTKCGGGSQRQYFNFLRNNSSDVYGIFSWSGSETQGPPESHLDVKQEYRATEIQQQTINQGKRDNKRVSFDNSGIAKDKNTNISLMETKTSEIQGKSTKDAKVVLKEQPRQSRAQSAPKTRPQKVVDQERDK